MSRPIRLGWAVGMTAAVAAVGTVLLVALGPVLTTPLKQVANKLFGYPASRRRAALGPEAPPFQG